MRKGKSTKSYLHENTFLTILEDPRKRVPESVNETNIRPPKKKKACTVHPLRGQKNH
jgi:hypothetical protein